MKDLYKTLVDYSKQNIAPMHMPGHKRNTKLNTELFDFINPYEIDVTEVEGTDDLHHPEEVLLYEKERCQRLYGSRESFLLINGSTGGILSAISACAKKGDVVLCARNCHKSVYHAIHLLGLKPAYLMPEFDSKTGIMGAVTENAVKVWMDQFEKEGKKPACAILTSPTYEGVCSDCRAIAKLLHKKEIPLVVDEAHGAHLAFMKEGCESALDAGADLVIQSIHKTLPAFTQTAVLHVGSYDYLKEENLNMYLQIYQTSSPSYILMSGISKCFTFLEENASLFLEYCVLLEQFYDKIKGLKTLQVLGQTFMEAKRDLSKIVVTCERAKVNGRELARILREDYQIETELSSLHYVIAMTSVADKKESFDRLAKALVEIDQEVEMENEQKKDCSFVVPEAVMSIYDAVHSDKTKIALEQAVDQIAAEYVYVYPPGIPIIVPGERIGRDSIKKAKDFLARGFRLRGMKDSSADSIQVVCREDRV